MRIEHATDADGPYANTYHIRVPGYALRTGTRLSIQPAFFQKGAEPLFARAERKDGIHFPFPWSEEDVVTIELPAGFIVEDPSPRKGIDVGGASYEPSLKIDGSRLEFRRSLAAAKRGVVYELPAYEPFRAFFAAVQRGDSEPVLLRRKDAAQ